MRATVHRKSYTTWRLQIRRSSLRLIRLTPSPRDFRHEPLLANVSGTSRLTSISSTRQCPPSAWDISFRSQASRPSILGAGESDPEHFPPALVAFGNTSGARIQNPILTKNKRARRQMTASSLARILKHRDLHLSTSGHFYLAKANS